MIVGGHLCHGDNLKGAEMHGQLCLLQMLSIACTACSGTDTAAALLLLVAALLDWDAYHKPVHL
jgi:hypothetical protein